MRGHGLIVGETTLFAVPSKMQILVSSEVLQHQYFFLFLIGFLPFCKRSE